MKLKNLVCLILITLVASISPAAHAQTFSVIHAFTGVPGQGGFPYAGVTIRRGVLYGTTQNTFDYGTVYLMSRTGSQWNFSTIFDFDGGNGGDSPMARVVFGADQHMYGTTTGGGNLGGGGTVFKLTPQASICLSVGCPWNENVLWNFNAFSYDGGRFAGHGDLVWDQQGNIYGTTSGGGNNDEGVIYELSPSGNGWHQSVLYSFGDLPDGREPYGGLIFDNEGNLWGTTAFGGANNQGTIFKLTNMPGVGWQKTTVYTFQRATDGSDVEGGLVMDSSGNFYGTTADGGSGVGGTVFELSPSGDMYTFKVLYSFSGYYFCGSRASLTMDAAGNLYGTTHCDGAYQSGNVFKLTNTPNGWVYSSLYDFSGGSDGNEPDGVVSLDSDGTLYGTTERGGSVDGSCSKLTPAGCGTVWMIKP